MNLQINVVTKFHDLTEFTTQCLLTMLLMEISSQPGAFIKVANSSSLFLLCVEGFFPLVH